MDVGIISTTTGVSMAFSDDQLTVSVSENQLTNGLSSPATVSPEQRQLMLSPSDLDRGNFSSVNSTTILSSATSTSCTTSPTLTTSSAGSNSSGGFTRFTVQPTTADQSIFSQSYNSNSTVTMTTAVTTSSSASGGSSNTSVSADPPQLGKQKKKVSFPDGESLIKGFAHAPNPWYNVSLCTTDNLVSAYVNSCNAHSVRPLAKLISQLKCIRDFGERINLLTLKGESINCKHVETLEEIFRRVQFNTVDMEATHLDDESAIALFEMVEYYESVVHLRISHNRNLGLRAWLSAARMLRRTQHLESIDIRGCSLNEQCMAVLGRALKVGAFIRVLYMQECNLSGRGVLIISAALRSISTIKELHIGENNLQPSDGIQLGNLIRNNTFLHTLDVRNNHLQDIGVAHICDGLAEQPNGVGLKSLNLSSNHFSPASLNVIAIALSRTKSLNTLNISHNNITNEGFFVLKEGLLKNKSLCRLALRGTKITDEGAVALAEYIADSYTISQLDLRDNEIKTAGLLAVSMCLKVQETITRLEIDQNVKKEANVKDYAAQQRFLLDELQSKVTQNAELQRAKLEKLLVQSKPERVGVVPTSHTEGQGDTKPTNEALGVTSHKVPASTTSACPSNDAAGYFDPLGAVSVGDGAEPPAQNGDIIPDTQATGELAMAPGEAIAGVSHDSDHMTKNSPAHNEPPSGADESFYGENANMADSTTTNDESHFLSLEEAVEPKGKTTPPLAPLVNEDQKQTEQQTSQTLEEESSTRVLDALGDVQVKSGGEHQLTAGIAVDENGDAPSDDADNSGIQKSRDKIDPAPVGEDREGETKVTLMGGDILPIHKFTGGTSNDEMVADARLEADVICSESAEPANSANGEESQLTDVHAQLTLQEIEKDSENAVSELSSESAHADITAVNNGNSSQETKSEDATNTELAAETKTSEIDPSLTLLEG